MPPIDAVVIGRNEGSRLIACLEALAGQVRRVVYVDSGSTDGSVQAATARGAHVVTLDMDLPFTAARARNAGLAALGDDAQLVQFLDGDCVLQPGWLKEAAAFLEIRPDVAVVCGRRREIYPENSVYNAMIDTEWDTPVGQADACGGDALMRVQPLRDAGGYRDDLIAGEEPELCLRLRKAGWNIWRLDAEMTLHDAQILRFGQWWRRTVRAGHAFAEGAWRFHTAEHPHWQTQARRIQVWGLGLPLAVLLGAVLHPALIGLALIYPLQILRLSRRLGWTGATFNTLGKLAEGWGALTFYARWFTGRRARLIEYK